MPRRVDSKDNSLPYFTLILHSHTFPYLSLYHFTFVLIYLSSLQFSYYYSTVGKVLGKDREYINSYLLLSINIFSFSIIVSLLSYIYLGLRMKIYYYMFVSLLYCLFCIL